MHHYFSLMLLASLLPCWFNVAVTYDVGLIDVSNGANLAILQKKIVQTGVINKMELV